MPISYTGNPAQSLNDALDTIGAVNGVSPKVTGSPTNASGAGSPSAYGLTPSQVSNQFGAAYDSATAGYAPFPDNGTEADIGQLQGVFNNIPSAFDVSGTLGKVDTARQTALTTGVQAANTAATKFQQSQIPGASTGVGGSMLRAQALLPYMQSDTSAAASEGQYADSAKQTALTTAASIADQLATLQQNYTNSLASYNSGKAQFGLNFANDQTGMALQASTANTQAQLSASASAAQIAEQAREANLSAALSTQSQQSQAAQTATNQQITAANDLLTNPKAAPSGSWVTSPTGQITSGQSDYAAYQNYLSGKSGAVGALGAIA